MCVCGGGGVGLIAVNCRRKVKYPLFRGGGERGGGCGYVVVVIGLLAKVSLRYVVFFVIQLLVKSLWHRTKVARPIGLKKCCRVVSSFAAEVRRLCCRVVISLKLSCSR